MYKVFTLYFFLMSSSWVLSQKGVYKLNLTVPPEVIREAPKDSVFEFPIIKGDLTIRLGVFGRVKYISKCDDGSVRIDKGWWTIEGNIIHIDLGITSDSEFDAEYIVYESGTYLKPVENGNLYLKKQ